MGNTNSLYLEAEQQPESFFSGACKGVVGTGWGMGLLGSWGGEGKELGPKWKGREEKEKVNLPSLKEMPLHRASRRQNTLFGCFLQDEMRWDDVTWHDMTWHGLVRSKGTFCKAGLHAHGWVCFSSGFHRTATKTSSESRKHCPYLTSFEPRGPNCTYSCSYPASKLSFSFAFPGARGCAHSECIRSAAALQNIKACK